MNIMHSAALPPDQKVENVLSYLDGYKEDRGANWLLLCDGINVAPGPSARADSLVFSSNGWARVRMRPLHAADVVTDGQMTRLSGWTRLKLTKADKSDCPADYSGLLLGYTSCVPDSWRSLVLREWWEA